MNYYKGLVVKASLFVRIRHRFEVKKHEQITMLTHLSKLIFFLYDILGIRFIWQKIRPPHPDIRERPPSTIVIWLVTTYVALYSLSTALYNQQYTSLNNNFNFISTISKDELSSIRIELLLPLWNEKIPVEPEPLNFGSFTGFASTLYSPAASLFTKNAEHDINKNIEYLIQKLISNSSKNSFLAIDFRDYPLSNFASSELEISFSKLNNIKSNVTIENSKIKNSHLNFFGTEHGLNLINNDISKSEIHMPLAGTKLYAASKEISFDGTIFLGSEIYFDLEEMLYECELFRLKETCVMPTSGVNAYFIDTELHIAGLDKKGQKKTPDDYILDVGQLCMTHSRFKENVSRLIKFNVEYQNITYAPYCPSELRIPKLFEQKYYLSTKADSIGRIEEFAQLIKDYFHARQCKKIVANGQTGASVIAPGEINPVTKALFGKYEMSEVLSIVVYYLFSGPGALATKLEEALQVLEWKEADQKTYETIEFSDCTIPEPPEYPGGY